MKHNEIEQEDWKDFAKNFPLYGQLRNKTIGITVLKIHHLHLYSLYTKN